MPLQHQDPGAGNGAEYLLGAERGINKIKPDKLGTLCEDGIEILLVLEKRLHVGCTQNSNEVYIQEEIRRNCYHHFLISNLLHLIKSQRQLCNEIHMTGDRRHVTGDV